MNQKQNHIHIQKRPLNQGSEKRNTGKKDINITSLQLKRIKGYQRIVAGLIFIGLPCIELYRRFYMNGERKMQQGEFNPRDGTIRKYTEEEKIKNFKNSWLTKIFGEK